MTRFQKIIVAVAIVAAALFIYQTRLTRAARADVAKLQAQQADLTNQIARLREALAAKDEQLSANPAQGSASDDSPSESELLKLRAEVTRAHALEREVAALRSMLAQSSHAMREWKTNDFSNAGRADPLSAFQTFLYFSQQTNSAAVRSGLVADDADPPTSEEMERFLTDKRNSLSDGLDSVSAFKVVSEIWQSPDKVQIRVICDMGESGLGIAVPFTLRNVSGEWKLILFNVRDANGTVQEVNYFEKKPNL